MISNYPDWLNPMLVKELRQGLSKGLFTGVFILLQLAMIVFMGLRLLDSDHGSDDDMGSYLDAFFWTGLGIVMLLIIPTRGTAAIQEEKKVQTLELVQMTHLGSRRIVWGKWVALISQVLLFVVAVLPYAVLRYFFGGMDVLDRAGVLGGMLLASMVMTALCIWLSSMGPAVRALAMIAAIMLVQVVMVQLFGAGSIFHVTAGDIPALVFGAVITTLFLLATAAAGIATVAENHSAVLRSIALTAAVTGAVGKCFGSIGWMQVGMPVMVWSMVGAMTECTSHVPVIYAPWLRWGLAGRLAARILTPGWASGMWFSFIITLLMTVAALPPAPFGPKGLQCMTAFALGWAGLVSPLAVLSFVTGPRHRGAIYLLVQLFCAGMFVVARAFDGADSRFAAVLLDSLTPTTAAMWAFANLTDTNGLHWEMFPLVTAPVALVLIVLIAVRSVREFRIMSQQEKRVLQPPSDA